MSQTPPLRSSARLANYRKQQGSKPFTGRQQKRLLGKLLRALNKGFFDLEADNGGS